QQLKKAWHPDGRALVARGSWRGDALYLVKPQSFMNVSGPSVRHVLLPLGAGPEDLVLVYDDIDMALGKVRTRLRGSAGGHNGVQSVIDALGTEAIRRVKIGIGRPAHKSQVPDHVLTTFEPEEEDTVGRAVAAAGRHPMGDERAAETMGDEHRRRRAGGDLMLEHRQPLRAIGHQPVALENPTEVSVRRFPPALPVPGTGVTVAGQHEHGRRHHGRQRKKSTVTIAKSGSRIAPL